MQIATLGNRYHLVRRALSKCVHCEYNNKLWTKYCELCSNILERGTIRNLKNHKEISEEDDLVFCLGYYKLIKPKYFEKPKHGTFVMHATDLPKGRGWAPVTWALIRNYERIHITSFKIDEGCDTGPYHMKSSVPINITDTYKSSYDKVDIEIVNHIISIVKEFRENGSITLHEQIGEPTWNPRRVPDSSELDKSKTLEELWSSIRACHNQDYPAFFRLNGKKIYLKYEVVDE